MSTPIRVSSSLRRRTTAASAALLLGLGLAACGGGDGSDESSDPTDGTSETSDAGGVPTEDELAATLLTASDVPAGFTESPADDTEEDTDDVFEDTCLGDIGQFSDALGFEPDSEAEVEYTLEADGGQAAVSSKVQAYADESAVAPAFTDFTDSLQECTSIETTDADGVTFALDIAYDDTVDLPGFDDQLAVDMTGTISSGDQSFDLTYNFVVGLSGPFVSIVGTYALGEDSTGVLDTTDDLAAAQAQRVTDQLG